jgi:signal transduction histidine kinase
VAGSAEEIEAARQAADEYLLQAWQVLGSSDRWAEFRDAAGVLLYRLGPTGGEPTFAGVAQPIEPSDVLLITHPIRDLDNGSALGALTAAVRLRTLLPDEALQVAFGRSGYSAVLDRASGRVLYHPSRTFFRQPLSMLIGPDGWDVSAVTLAQESGRFTFEDGDTTRVASFAALSDPSWTIVATTSVAEFAPPFARTRLINLAVILSAAMVISLAFLLVTKRMTRSLGALTAAADEVARGNFEPALPPSGADEVGKLTTAFGLMVHRVREMLDRIRESRHLAAVGQFASQLSHEIRNPLTSIKLNLQRLERDVADNRIPQDYSGPITICLREVKRLDRVAGGVLSVARTRAVRHEPCSVHEAVHQGLETLRPQLDASGIEVRSDLRASSDVVAGDAEQLKGVFLNLFLNALDAMPEGGSLQVTSELRTGDGGLGQLIAVRVADRGPGVPEVLQDRIFEPFVSTKEEGTGFGLALVQQAVEEHEGAVWLEDGARAGAVFVVELPLASIEEPR